MRRSLQAAGELPHPDDILASLAGTLGAVPQDEIADRETYDTARAKLLDGAEAPLRRARRLGPTAPFDRGDIGAFEAVVRVDGTRPSLMLRCGKVPDDHPHLGAWGEDILSFRDTVARLAAAVGRIEPEFGSANDYFGTGFVIDAGKGHVLTNRHVLEDMLSCEPGMPDPNAGTHRFERAVFVDFAAEIGSAARDRFKVVSGRPIGNVTAEHTGPDAAILRIEPVATGDERDDRPCRTGSLAAIELSGDLEAALGQTSSCVLVGFPGIVPPPGLRGDREDTVDWDWITYELMGGRHGVKRLAPGVVHRPYGGLGRDAPGCFGHDATTLGGSSGSPVVAWKDRGSPAFGLHFAGRTMDANHAHAIRDLRTELDEAARRI